MDTNELGLEIWDHNYKYDDETDVRQMWRRIAHSGAQAEKEEDREVVERQFYNILLDWKFIPGGRIMANLGTDRKNTTLLNCFVHNPGDLGYSDPDSINGIYDMLKAQAHTLKSEGGYGMNFSWIRPKGTYIHGIDSRTPGVVKFMELWDKSSEIITMGSDIIIGEIKKNEKKKIRKGAMMGILSCWHPEIMDFIKAKQTPNRLTKFNMSVGIFGDFMKLVANDGNWSLKYPDTTHPAYDHMWDGNIYEWEDNGFPVIVYQIIKARELWDLLMSSTYTRNEPGVVFFDITNKMSPMSGKEFNQTTNPCGEIPMPLDACLLGSVNLTQFVNDKLEFDYTEFGKTVRTAIRFLDNVNDLTGLPLPEYAAAKKRYRRIGLGTMGLGSLHFMLGIRYGSPESLELVEQIYQTKAENEIMESAVLGREKGSFPEFDSRHYFNTTWWETLPISQTRKHFIEDMGCMRNSHRSMNAPTGNTSTLANQVSGGIEPVFMKEYLRWMIVPEHDRIQLKDAGFEFPEALNGEWFETEYLKFSKKGDEQILKGTFENVDYEVDKNRGLIKSAMIRDYGWEFATTKMCPAFFEECEVDQVFATTEELTVDEHLGVLATIAKYVDQNSSKTVNLPNDYSYDNFKNLYIRAWEAGIKGLTTYRAGTMTAVLEKKKENVRYQNELDELFAQVGDDVIKDIGIRLPNQYHSKGYIRRDQNKKKWYIHIAFADSSCLKPFALFVSTNSKETTEVADALIETIETLCQSKGISQELVEALKVRCAGQSNTVKIARAIGLALRHNISIKDIVETLEKFDEEFSSFVYHITKLLSQFIKDGTKAIGETCPECKQDTIIYYEGCKQCKQCNWSKC